VQHRNTSHEKTRHRRALYFPDIAARVELILKIGMAVKEIDSGTMARRR
jgi:hypothetical protein